jgi:hypothetical protein
MGTRADFFIGRGDNSRWLGSVPYDGFIASNKTPFGVSVKVLEAKSEEEFESRVEEFFEEKERMTIEHRRAMKEQGFDNYGDDSVIIIRPNEPWPWPWPEFSYSDYSYAFDQGKVWCCHMFYDWYDPLNEKKCEEQRKEIYGHTRFKYGV